VTIWMTELWVPGRGLSVLLKMPGKKDTPVGSDVVRLAGGAVLVGTRSSELL
jgi:hypothetical protein